MKFVLASHNKDKLREVNQILSGTGIEVVFARDLGYTFEPEENGASFYENAKIKATSAAEFCKMPAIGDDSGLCVDALNGAPGIYSARFGGEELSYDGKCDLLIKKLENTENRSAHFVTATVCVFPDGSELAAQGELKGKISTEKKGVNGFGYDPVFIPDGFYRTTAEMTAEEKNSISHRGKALSSLAELLKEKIKIEDNR